MPPIVRQAAAIPIRDGKVCLITSRSRRRWVVPKGHIEVHQSPREAAELEAWEEAGLIGTISDESIGSYEYEKYGRRHVVSVYLLDVSQAKSDWPERSQRNREWLSPADAAGRIEEEKLQVMVRNACTCETGV